MNTEDTIQSKYLPTIGLEIHTELKTKSKMFCGCKNDPFNSNPNSNTCPVCLGLPGVMPVINQQAVELVIKVGKAVGGKISQTTKWDRKNYFYPDLPKGYQISQYDTPLVKGGHLEIFNKFSNINLQKEDISNVTKGLLRDGKRIINITRLHLEEDTGKLLHPAGSNYSLIDYNRSGVPLMELVTEPDIKSGQEASEFAKKFQQLLRHLGVADADMEKGMMRVEVNISLKQIQNANIQNSKPTEENTSEITERLLLGGKLGTKVEIKNLNSFKSVEKSIDYEIKRQSELLEKGEKIIQETRGWDDNKEITFSQRIKETENDYRYFPEPDLPPLSFSQNYIDSIVVDKLPDNITNELIEKYALKENDAKILTSNKEKLKLFEVSRKEIRVKENELASFIVNRNPKTREEVVDYFISRENLLQNEDLEVIVHRIIQENQDIAKKIKNGKIEAKQALIGLVMKETQGKASGEMTKKIIEKIII
ncbi:Asp-tRNA(Asn)/Glu-tRNA(Gln) amidotransferase subunit GatB [Candidatus Berkelbacteria bacterium CG_4_10_14_0_8_um_filter_35_9_33_8]|uniref:Aspartyl/glutamyl-tRNA(Asn/Gln) amidotransferase subunit B n=1 Tax=Candidatus Berkelbacteria bacterium CG_4_10_14_0_2_um_filter_35_9_33_12 TaxID=1974499 RepID=A0A2M7W4D8_9BACT|nr:MAG: Asp-tRNA(Asn)/Glu-tRNA(Gln) amidotransferase GatCAB subunit B [Candidatus Berkelbacteria bacterium CG23_combo_of_CG06-09_8_20_14_all_33_15]PIZ28210.1 MAG: Asp-tRNA(Asn)/Glu-tRNA(Gln) amidotransferase subunit GatB [Candidatus Berkelbacteria bacterium CG_4_10_14_0_8_um_filter_35_9_33_8]PJA20637.1 MAG: Asp-tRNA(Asn)/Glu-tRNA(Gln) amidotransferase subunit GatB [Candidatus Berkelbacteria bacterium CG_4_10_14_0_2_um_filter_35_9_33_12]